MENKTILYVSSNREDINFEKRIQDNLLEKSGNIPIIAVTQKPVDLGNRCRNIVVGDVGTSGFNMFRQVLLGCKEADTKFIISAEADCLYSPDYFKFVPPKDNVCYRNENTYIMGLRRDFFFKKKEGGTWSQIIGREFYIDRLEYLFEGAPMWSPEEKNFPKERKKGTDVFEPNQIERFTTEYPCISLKSGDGMRGYSHSENIPIYELPYWGDGKSFRAKYL